MPTYTFEQKYYRTVTVTADTEEEAIEILSNSDPDSDRDSRVSWEELQEEDGSPELTDDDE